MEVFRGINGEQTDAPGASISTCMLGGFPSFLVDLPRQETPVSPAIF